MEFNKMTRYQRTDIIRGKEDQLFIFDSTKTEGEMIDLAVQHNCRIILKGGDKGRWYLKGRDMDHDLIISKINNSIGNSRDGVYILYLEK